MQRVLAKSRVVLHDLQALGCISLVLGRRVVILAVHCAHDSNNFSGFGFLGHLVGPLTPSNSRLLAGQPEDYAQPSTRFATFPRGARNSFRSGVPEFIPAYASIDRILANRFGNNGWVGNTDVILAYTADFAC